MKRGNTHWFAHTSAICILALVAGLLLLPKTFGDDGAPAADPPPYPPQYDTRSGGVLAESYRYHRHAPPPLAPHPASHPAAPNIAPAAGWYGYGFPVQSYRWGWFGAQRYYPRVVWHRGYYDDCCRWGYRQGY